MKNVQPKSIPFVLLCAYALKSLITGAGINEVLLIGILASLTGFYESRMSDKRFKELQKEFEERIKDVKEHNNIQDAKIEALQSANLNTKLATSLKGITR